MIPREQRENCEFTHNVSCNELTIFVSFAIGIFNIDYLISKIWEEAKKSDLFRYGSKVHRPIVQKYSSVKLSDLDELQHEVSITFTAQ